MIAIDYGLFVLAQQRLQIGVFDDAHVHDDTVSGIEPLALRFDFEESLLETRGYAVSHFDVAAEVLHDVIQNASHAI